MSDVEDFAYLVNEALKQSTFPELTAALPAIGEYRWTTMQVILEVHAELVQFARKGVKTRPREDQTLWENGEVKYYITKADGYHIHLVTYPQARNQEEYRASIIYEDRSSRMRVDEYDNFAKRSVHYHVFAMGIDIEVYSSSSASAHISVKISPDSVKLIVDVVGCSYVAVLDRVSRQVTVERVTDLYVGD